MEFQLVIRNTIEAEGNVFGAADVRLLNNQATVGTTTDCDVRIDDEELAADALLFRVEFDDHGISRLLKTGPETVYVNNEPVTGPTANLVSGDEIRVGHWTFRFQKVRQRVGIAHRTNLMALVAKILIAVIILGEILLAVWLPKRLKYENMVAIQILEEQCVMRLDQLRHTIDRMETPIDPTPEENLRAAAVRIVDEELDAMALHIRKHRETIPAENWSMIRDELDRLQSLLIRIDTGRVFHPVPKLRLDDDVQYVLDTPPEQL